MKKKIPSTLLLKGDGSSKEAIEDVVEKKQELTLMQNYNLKLLFLVMYSNKKKTEKLKHGTII